MCCIHKLFSQRQKGHGDPAESILAFHGVTSTSETMCQARLGRGPFPPHPYQCPEGWEQQGGLGRPSAQRQPGAVGSATLAPRKPPALHPGTPCPQRPRGALGALGTPAGQRGLLPTASLRRLQAWGLGPSPRADAPREDSQSPQQFLWAWPGCHRSGVPEGLSPAVPGVTWDASRWQHLLVARSGSSLSAGWTQVTAGGPVTRGVLSHPELQDELAVHGQDGRAMSGL